MVMSCRVKRWCRNFIKGLTNIHGKERGGKPSIVMEEFVRKVEKLVWEYHCLTVDKLHEMCPEIGST